MYELLPGKQSKCSHAVHCSPIVGEVRTNSGKLVFDNTSCQSCQVSQKSEEPQKMEQNFRMLRMPLRQLFHLANEVLLNVCFLRSRAQTNEISKLDTQDQTTNCIYIEPMIHLHN